MPTVHRRWLTIAVLLAAVVLVLAACRRATPPVQPQVLALQLCVSEMPEAGEVERCTPVQLRFVVRP
jgi:predicted component of type VI protein secretion system